MEQVISMYRKQHIFAKVEKNCSSPPLTPFPHKVDIEQSCYLLLREIEREERKVEITARLTNGDCKLDSCSMLGTLGKKSRLNVKSKNGTLANT